MKNKPKDVKYCNVSKGIIQMADPLINTEMLNLFSHYILERYRVHVSKDVLKKDKPWTEDKILQQFKFTNVRREHDRETKWVIENIIENDDLIYEDKLLNIILFRLFNKHETLDLIGAPIAFIEEFHGDFDFESYRVIFEDYCDYDPKYSFFTGAFNTGGMKKTLQYYLPENEDNMCMRVMKFLGHLIDINITEKILACRTQYNVFDLLRSYKGIGDFLAYQIFVDFTYIPEFPFSENEFTIAGLGCRKGIDEVFVAKDGMNYEECIFYMRDNWYKLMEHIIEKNWFFPEKEMVDCEQHDRCMNVMSIENCFCEFSKYVRAYMGKGRIRKYNGT